MSLKKHCPEFKLWILCMDSICYDILSKLHLPNVVLITLEDFERNDKELLEAKQNRSQIEYYFTCTPSLPLYLLNRYSEIEMITYLDADLFFFSNPQAIYDEIDKHSIAIIGHRFPREFYDCKKFGIYNVGWLSFRRDDNALACLRRWRSQCIKWCYDRVEDKRFADQKYLDKWPTSFNNVKVIRHLGANAAPWNLNNYNITKHKNTVWIDKYPLIFFHFHGLSAFNSWVYNPNLSPYRVKPSAIIRKDIFGPHIRTLLNMKKYLSPLSPQIAFLNATRLNLGTSNPLRLCQKVLYGEYLLSLGGFVL